MKHVKVFRYSRTFIKEWAINQTNIKLVTLHGTEATGYTCVVLSIKHETDVLRFLFGGCWLFCWVSCHQVEQVFDLKQCGCFQRHYTVKTLVIYTISVEFPSTGSAFDWLEKCSYKLMIHSVPMQRPQTTMKDGAAVSSSEHELIDHKLAARHLYLSVIPIHIAHTLTKKTVQHLQKRWKTKNKINRK